MRLTDSQIALFMQGAQHRVDEAMGLGHKSWLGKLFHRVYDMGQNVDLAFQELKLRGDKEINWLALPGHEVCSTLVASIIQNGLFCAGQGNWFLDQLQAAVAKTGDKMIVRGPQDVDPAMFWLLPDLFRIKKPGETVRPFSIVQWMSYSEPKEQSLIEIFVNVVKSPLAFMSTFSRGIKVYQKAKKRPYPAYLTTHSTLTLPPDNDQIKYISQEALTFLKHYKQSELLEKTSGPQPRYVILEPTFIYPEGA
jgi:hypothetical protein